MVTAIDLFSGAGGASQGLVDAGFELICAVDNDEAATVTYCTNHSTPVVLVGDIRTMNPAWLRTDLCLDVGDLALLNACPPCQGWSSLGNLDEDDVRNELVDFVSTIICEFRPKCWMLENVPRLAGDRRLDRLIQTSKEAGYGVRKYQLDAQDFGVPQRRRRLIVIGVRDMSTESLPEDLLSAIPAEFDRSPRTAGEAITIADCAARFEDPLHQGRRHTRKVVERIASIPVGGNRFDLPQSHQLACHRRMTKLNAAAAAYGRIRSDEVAPTMTTRCTTPSCGSFIHPTENRGITLREAALIQTFPRTYAFLGTYGQKESQIGNALPPRMAQGIALAIKEFLNA